MNLLNTQTRDRALIHGLHIFIDGNFQSILTILKKSNIMVIDDLTTVKNNSLFQQKNLWYIYVLFSDIFVLIFSLFEPFTN